MKLYFVRHGRTQWNEEGRFQGASGDSELLPTAIEELHLLGQSLAAISFDKIFSSDLQRALTTAEILNQENNQPQTIITTSAMREWQLGRLEGSKIATMEAIYPLQIQAFRSNLAKFNNRMFEAESVYQTTKRVTDFLLTLKDKDYENVLIVGHGANLVASIRSLLGYEVGNLRDRGGLRNGSLTILETKDFEHFELLTWNNLDYLQETQTVKA